MPKILIVEKGGEIKELNSKTYTEEDLFKKAGFKTADGFQLQTQWELNTKSEKKTISLYAKTKGRAGQENKYDFPPPVDNKLYFGSCVLTKSINETESDLSLKEWEQIYEHLFGGFENLGSEDSELSTDGEEYANVPRTKEGYVIDDFIVDSSDDEELIDDVEVEKELIKIPKSVAKTPKKIATAKSKPKTKSKSKSKKTVEFDEEESNLLDNTEDTSSNAEFEYTRELEEEEYV